MYLVIGLGNPDKKYLNTYHNLGFLCVERLAAMLNAGFSKGECRALTAHARIFGEKVIIAKPVTYMNLSGESAVELINKYKIEKNRFLVIYDDIDIPLGTLRIRYAGSSGTHNGMRSIVGCVGAEDFARIRIGIGGLGESQPDRRPLSDFVLDEINAEALQLLAPALDFAARAAKEFAQGTPITDVMQRYNKK